MRHNNFKFTIKFVLPKDRNGDFLKEYVEQCCDRMYQRSAEIKEMLTSNAQMNTYVSYLTLTMKDYGVPEVGVDLVATWVGLLYRHCKGFVVEVVIVHPKTDPPAKGAVIQWDYINNCPIIRAISSK